MNKINELDKAGLKYDFKQMSKNIGRDGCLQVLYELLLSASILCDVIKEDYTNTNDKQ